MNNKIEGIVLKNVDYRDQDALLTVLSKENGRIDFVARGLRKITSKNAGSSQMFQHSYFYYNEKGNRLQSLKTSELIDSFRHLRDQLLTQCISEVMCEVMSKIEINDPSTMYDLLYQSFNILQTSKKPYAILSVFMAIILRYQGIEPCVDHCVRCHTQQGIVTLSLLDGGFICGKCINYSDTKMKKEELKKFRILMKASLQHIEIVENSCDINYQDFERIVSYFIEYSGINLSSISFLKRIESMNS
ncbi:MAG: DNA repair protein RecO [Erysipelotrichaceae bacterium]